MFFRKDSEVGYSLGTICLGKDNRRIISFDAETAPYLACGRKSNSKYIYSENMRVDRIFISCKDYFEEIHKKIFKRRLVMGNITIRIPQQVHIEYTLKNAGLTKRILDLLNTLIVRDDNVDSGLKKTVTEELSFSELASELFGTDGGVDLELPRYPPHQPPFIPSTNS
ncbi:hypothetical protein H206_02501 [Candidatus Electrothrix aarhusensis]|uniref:Uncharacterized protein n=1 Tax=Candidatus Electrothrix aarhusensis TaxID=1859131 RepID=A0A3S3U789_9BACT|nr:hypothetical protein H206_02501 [Candidatus Electrothrix aarhusensis]